MSILKEIIAIEREGRILGQIEALQWAQEHLQFCIHCENVSEQLESRIEELQRYLSSTEVVYRSRFKRGGKND